MVGRRQLREKVVETLYAYQQNPKEVNLVLKNMMGDINKIYNLYVYELNFLLALRELAKEQIEIRKNKFIKSEEDLNPNIKFVENRILVMLEANEERRQFTEKNKQLTWDATDDVLRHTFQRMLKSKKYLDYMQSSDNSFEDDQKFIGRIFLRFVAENKDLHDYFESQEMYWADAFHIANSLVQKTIGFMKADQEMDTLMKVIKNSEDRNFVQTLLTKTIYNQKSLTDELSKRLQNWDLERISLIDRVIILTAFSEMDNFKTTPSSIIINEYIEIAKAFSSDKANVFINGLLDKYAKDHNRN